MATMSHRTGQVEPNERSYGLLVKGWYQGQITESNVKATDRGERLEITVELSNQGFRGRKVWGGFNYKHSSAEAQRISQQQLDELCAAIGLQGELTDSVQLHNKPFNVYVSIRKGTGINAKTGLPYDDKNEPVGFKPIGESVQLVVGGSAPAANSSGSAPAPKPAWQQGPAQPPAPAAAPAEPSAAPAPAGAPAAPWLKK